MAKVWGMIVGGLFETSGGETYMGIFRGRVRSCSGRDRGLRELGML